MKRSSFRWKTKDGRTLTIDQIDNIHLRNIIARMLRNGTDMIRYGCSGPSAEDMYYDEDPNPVFDFLVREYERRRLPIFWDNRIS